MSWRDQLAPGDVIEGPEWNASGNKLMGIVLEGDDGDDTILVTFPKPDEENNPEADAWTTEWVKLAEATDLSDSEPGREMRAQFPISPLSPEYIFMVIRPPRQIETFANLDALLAADVEMAYPSTGKLPLKQAAAEAIADPETDIKLHPNRNVYLRFTQVEGA